MSNKITPICPKCGETAIKRKTKHGIKYFHCNLWAWGKYPLVDKTTHKLRIQVHSKFDPIWKLGGITRKQAYKKLAKELNIPLYKTHMKLMNKTTLKKVLNIVEHWEEK